MEKELKIIIPEGYEIDKEKSSFEKIVFKKIKEKSKRWRDNYSIINGFFIDSCSEITQCSGWNASPDDYNLFATEKYAKRAIAEARISQIMINDKRFGGVITNNEWKDDTKIKYVIIKQKGTIRNDFYHVTYQFLAFHTKEQCDLFMEENMDLIKDYFMID